jgi:FAD/FMN-containing dehydrogenase
MKTVFVAPESSTAYIGPGANFGDIFPIIEQYNLHIPTGDCPTVCISGFMMGGGYGMTSRAYGMNCDCVLQVAVMLADGKIVIANASRNEDLYWAICGGTGGNFGVLLQVGFQAFPLDIIYGVQIRWPIEADPVTAAKVLHTIQEQYLQDNVYSQLGIETILSSNDSGVKTIFFCATWIGDEQAFKTALQPLLSINGYTMKSYQGKYSYVNNLVLDGTPDVPDDIMAYSRSAYISRSLSQADWYNIAQYFYNTAPNQYTMIDMEAYGGKINQIAEGTNAFIHRNKKVDFFVDAFFDVKTNDRKQNEEWTKALFKFMDQYTDGESYQNYPNRDQEDFREAYWGRYYNQLVLIKQKYDPGNFFNYQQSIGPDLINDPKQVILFQPSPIVYENY